ncbi:hypothetical protein HK405_000162 [Cladochytrium tenue]|nr:hypothetical protein HK405_000162 [Cladochytrium tenue]
MRQRNTRVPGALRAFLLLVLGLLLLAAAAPRLVDGAPADAASSIKSYQDYKEKVMDTGVKTFPIDKVRQVSSGNTDDGSIHPAAQSHLDNYELRQTTGGKQVTQKEFLRSEDAARLVSADVAQKAGRSIIPELNNQNGASDGLIKSPSGRITAVVENKGTPDNAANESGQSGMFQAAAYAAGLPTPKNGKRKPPTLFAFNGASTAHVGKARTFLDGKGKRKTELQIKTYNMNNELDRHRVQAQMNKAAKSGNYDRRLHKAERAKLWNDQRLAASKRRSDKITALDGEVDSMKARQAASLEKTRKRNAGKPKSVADAAVARLKRSQAAALDSKQKKNGASAARLRAKNKSASDAAAVTNRRLAGALAASTSKKEKKRAEGRKAHAAALQQEREANARNIKAKADRKKRAGDLKMNNKRNRSSSDSPTKATASSGSASPPARKKARTSGRK